MTNLGLSLTTFAALGAYTFFIFRWWYAHLLNLRDKYELAVAQKLAARWRLVILLLIGISHMASLGFVFNLKALNPVIVVALFSASVIPGFVWWARHTGTLQENGMYPLNRR